LVASSTHPTGRCLPHRVGQLRTGLLEIPRPPRSERPCGPSCKQPSAPAKLTCTGTPPTTPLARRPRVWPGGSGC